LALKYTVKGVYGASKAAVVSVMTLHPDILGQDQKVQCPSSGMASKKARKKFKGEYTTSTLVHCSVRNNSS